MRALDVATKFESWKFVSETMTDVLSRFSFTTAAEKQLKHRNHCKKQYFLVVGWKKWCLKKGITKEIENYEPTQLKTAGAIRN